MNEDRKQKFGYGNAVFTADGKRLPMVGPEWDPQWEIPLKRGGYLSESYQEVHQMAFDEGIRNDGNLIPQYYKGRSIKRPRASTFKNPGILL